MLQERLKTLKAFPYCELEKILIEWLHQACSANIPITGIILREEAVEISFALDITKFSASNG